MSPSSGKGHVHIWEYWELTNNKEHVEFQAEVPYSLFQECKWSQQSTALPPAKKVYVIYRSCVLLYCMCCNIRVAVGTWLLSSDLSVYKRPNHQPQGLTCMVALRQLSLWFLRASFYRTCGNVAPIDTNMQDLTLSIPPLKGPTWDLGTWDDWKYTALIQASALISGLQPTLSWPSCLTLYSLTLLYISSGHISLLTFHIYSPIVSLSTGLQCVFEGRDHIVHLFATKSHMCMIEFDT